MYGVKCKWCVQIAQIMLCQKCTVNVYSIGVQCLEFMLCTVSPDNVVHNMYS